MSVWALLLGGNLCETSAPPSPQAAPTSLPHETNAGTKKFSRVDVFTYLVRGLALEGAKEAALEERRRRSKKGRRKGGEGRRRREEAGESGAAGGREDG